MIVVLEDLDNNSAEYLGSDSDEVVEVTVLGVGPQGPKGSGGIETVAGVAPVGDDVPVSGLRANLGIDSEATQRASADALLQDAIDNLDDALDTEIATRSTAVSDEASARSTADADLAERIDMAELDLLAEAQQREDGDDGLGTAINAEVQARTEADSDIIADLNAESTARSQADADLQANITAEATARANADTTLSGRIATLENTDYDEEGSAAAVQAELDAHEAQTTGAHNLAALLGGKADLVGGKIPSDQLPSIAITDTFPVEDQAAMLALTAERGDVAVRADSGRAYILRTEPAATLSNWVELSAPGVITSVNGQTGAVVLTAANVGADPLGSAEEVANDLTTEIAARIAADTDLQNQIDNIEAGGSANIATIVNLVDGPRVIISATEPVDPEPGDYWFESLDAMVEAFSEQGPKGDDGDAGPSAYAVAVANGFVGDQAAWLASLEGSPGDDAYQVAVQNGFEGTEEEWLDSLQGGPGDPGPGVPVGGDIGQVLAKIGAGDFETDWVEQTGGSGSGNAVIIDVVDGPKIVISATEPVDPDPGDYWFESVDEMMEVFTAVSEGPPGPGVPEGGVTGQVLAKATDDDHDTEWVDQAEAWGTAGGDLEGSYPDPTIGNGKVTLAKMADVASGTMLGRSAGGSGVLSALTASQIRTLLGLATVATSGAYADLSGKPSIPDSPDDIGAATAAQGDKADTAIQGTSLRVPPSPIGATDGHVVKVLNDAYVIAPDATGDADLAANGKGFVAHGSTASTARPSGFASVEWFGTVEPSNWIDGDTWIDPTEA